VTTDEVLLGLGLTIALAVGSQVLASRLRIPAIIVLLPVGFAAGNLTSVVDPLNLLGSLFQPLVSLAVAVILFDSGTGLSLRRLPGDTRRVVRRLIGLGVPITLAVAAATAAPLLGMSERSAIMLGAILVVSGPTVVGPLLGFVRPNQRLQTALTWDGSLIDPIGGIIGALVFHGVVASGPRQLGSGLLRFTASISVGLAGAAVGTAVLWLLLRRLDLGEVLGTQATVAVVVAVAAVCDVIRDDTGLIAAVVIGLALTNLPGFDLPARRPFFETVVQLIIGLLFITISATVTPVAVLKVLPATLLLIAVLVLFARPLVAAVSTVRTSLSWGERAFVGWMAPRGIVAASTASAFSPSLIAHGIPGASKILPATFLVIVGTVTIYGLTATPVARLLGVTRPARSRPLLVGGVPWVIDLGSALGSAGLEVLMWAGLERQRERIASAGLELASGELLAAASGGDAELEGVSAVLLLTGEDDFNALASMTLRDSVDGPVYRAAPRDSYGVVAPYTADQVLFGASLTRAAISGRHHNGARILTLPDGGGEQHPSPTGTTCSSSSAATVCCCR
jgi:NhaP-type Na+/H+ or K+/H+ antiporter